MGTVAPKKLDISGTAALHVIEIKKSDQTGWALLFVCFLMFF